MYLVPLVASIFGTGISFASLKLVTALEGVPYPRGRFTLIESRTSDRDFLTFGVPGRSD